MIKNNNLNKAKREKNDEFYTQLSDIEKEINYYRDFFRDRIVYCNCDDPRKSNFFKYFSMNFEFLGLKQLICTAYNKNGKGVTYTYNGDLNGNKVVDDEEIEVKELDGNGDFRSEECIEILKSADVVVTNPPFSLFREYIAQLIEYGKKFLIIGNMNALKYKEIFPLFKENKMWVGNAFNASFIFQAPYKNELNDNAKFVISKGYNPDEGYIKVQPITWYTNIDYEKRHEPLDLYKSYKEEDYPKYDNFNAIECNKVCDIPIDYYGYIGVPITFIGKYCPEQFDIIGELNHGCDNEYDLGKPEVNGKYLYPRILIKHKNNLR